MRRRIARISIELLLIAAILAFAFTRPTPLETWRARVRGIGAVVAARLTPGMDAKERLAAFAALEREFGNRSYCTMWSASMADAFAGVSDEAVTYFEYRPALLIPRLPGGYTRAPGRGMPGEVGFTIIIGVDPAGRLASVRVEPRNRGD